MATTEAKRLANVQAADAYMGSPAYLLDSAEELGYSRDADGVRRYQTLLAEQAAREAYQATPAYLADCKADSDREQAEMRREVGLPGGVAPDSRLCRVNGSVGVWVDGGYWFGGFGVAPGGRLVKSAGE